MAAFPPSTFLNSSRRFLFVCLQAPLNRKLGARRKSRYSAAAPICFAEKLGAVGEIPFCTTVPFTPVYECYAVLSGLIDHVPQQETARRKVFRGRVIYRK